MPRRCRGIRGDAPQGYLFRFAPLRGHRPLRTAYRNPMRHIRANRPVRPYIRLPYLRLIPALSFRGAKRRGNPFPASLASPFGRGGRAQRGRRGQTKKGRPPAALFYPQPEVALPFQEIFPPQPEVDGQIPPSACIIGPKTERRSAHAKHPLQDLWPHIQL